MTEVKKSLSATIKEALAKKHASLHPDSKSSNEGGTTKKRTGPQAGAGKVMKKAAGRGR